MKKLLSGSASVALLAAFAAGSAQAQTSSPAGAQAEQGTSVTEVVVTAQKREQRLQDVPIEVQSLPAAQLQAAGVLDIKDMQILTPGLTVTSTSNEAITTARIRGVGTVGDNPGLEDSVGVVIDGVYRPRNGVSFGDLGEMDRVEVLEGPQGTTFGENTTAGVINVITKAPSFTFGAQGEATFGNYGEKGGSISITGPITSTLAGRIYFADRQRDGFYDVNTGVGPRTNGHDQDQNFWTTRGQLLWQPTDTFSVRAIADYTKRNENCCAAVQTTTGSTGAIINALSPAGGLAATPDPFSRQAYLNQSTAQNIEDYGFQIQADLDVKSLNSKITSITSARSWDGIFGQDLDYSGADVFSRASDGSTQTRFNTVTEELRIAGSSKHFDWLGGFYFQDERLMQDTAYDLGSEYTPYVSLLLTSGLSASEFSCFDGNFLSPSGPCNGPGYTVGKATQDQYVQNSTSYSFFTNDTWKITDRLDLTAGVRWNHETKTLDTHYQNLNGNGAACGGVLNNYQHGYLGLLGLTPAQQQQIVAVSCLNFVDPLYGNLSTRQSKSEDNVSDTVKLSYRWSPEVLTYASYAHGFKDGGFNLDRVATTTGLPSGSSIGGVIPTTDTYFKPETTDSYEVGVKTNWLHNKLLLNLTWFYQEYKDFQLNQFNGLAFDVETIPKVMSKGFDGQLQWITGVPGLTFNAGFTYAMTRYGDFGANDLTSPADFYGIPGTNQGLTLLPGNRISFAPLWSTSLGVNYDHRINDAFRFMFNVSAKTLSSYNTGSDLAPEKEQPGYTLVNGRFGFGSADNRYRLEFWSENLTNQNYRQVVFDAPLQPGTFDAFLGQPRTYGVTLRVKY